MAAITEDRAGPSSRGEQGPAPAVELRVHGVGGSTPEALLGVARPTDTVRVGGGPISAFWARRDEPGVEGHIWGGLTTQSSYQPFWLLLLPFTLLNVAGFMHRGRHEDGPVRVQRVTLRVLGYALTLSWALWLGTIVIEQLAWSGLADARPLVWLGQAEPLGPGARVLLGALGCLLLLGAGLVVALHTTPDFEGFEPPEEVRAQSLRPGRRLTLEDPGFWWQLAARLPRLPGARKPTWTDGEIVGHTVVALLAIVVATARAWQGRDVGAGAAPLGVGRLLVPVVALQLVLLVVLAVASGAETRAQRRRTPRPLPRLLGPFGTAALAVGLTQLSFGGVAVALGRWSGVTDAATRPEQALADVVGLAVVTFVIGALVLLAVHSVAGGERARVAELLRPPRPAAPLEGLPSPGWVARVARARKRTRVLSRIGWALAPPAAIVLAGGLLKLWPSDSGRFATWSALLDGRLTYPIPACGRGPVGSVVPFLTTGCGGTGISSALATAGLSLIGLALVGGPLVLYRAARSPRVRALVGVLWDILTFWPRWHHPFGVRSYAERVVPELQHRVLHHVVPRNPDGTPVPEDRWRPLVLSVHSQGTVIALAAIASLPTSVTRKVSVISFGSPLTTLYARFYPAYFGRAADPADAELRGDFADADRRVRRWRNFYRLTDYIGQQVTGVEDSTELPDPCSEQQEWPPPHRVDEAPRVPWTEIAGHSGYRRERAVQQAVADARGLAPRAHPPGPPG